MDLRKAVIKMVNTVSGGWTVAAAHLGMTENALRNRVYETKGQSLSTNDKIALQELSGTTHFVDALAATSGGTFVKLPSIDETENDSIQKLFAENYRELGRLYDAYSAAIQDDEITDAEMARIAQHVNEVHRKTAMLKALIPRIYRRTAGTAEVANV